MGEKYIKKEGDKEVVYEKGFLIDTKIGELHEKLDGSKETRNIFGTNVKVEREGLWSTGRKAEIDSQKGRFEKGFWDHYPLFKPEITRKDISEESNSTDIETRGSGYNTRNIAGEGDGSSVRSTSSDSDFPRLVWLTLGGASAVLIGWQMVDAAATWSLVWWLGGLFILGGCVCLLPLALTAAVITFWIFVALVVIAILIAIVEYFIEHPY